MSCPRSQHHLGQADVRWCRLKFALTEYIALYNHVATTCSRRLLIVWWLNRFQKKQSARPFLLAFTSSSTTYSRFE